MEVLSAPLPDPPLLLLLSLLTGLLAVFGGRACRMGRGCASRGRNGDMSEAAENGEPAGLGRAHEHPLRSRNGNAPTSLLTAVLAGVLSSGNASRESLLQPGEGWAAKRASGCAALDATWPAVSRPAGPA